MNIITLFLSYGNPGDGKTTQHVSLCKCLPDSIYLVLERKDEELLERKGEGIVFKVIEQFDENYMEDPIATLDNLHMQFKEIMNGGKYKNIFVDGVSDIRGFAMKEWIHNDNRERKAQGLKLRESIMGENLSAWAAINDRTKGIIRPLVNWATVKRTNVFFTAQMKDNYIKNQKVGQAINIGEWLEYDVDVKCKLYRDKEGNFMATFVKVPGWANECESDIPISKDSFIAVLAERGLIR